MHKNKVLFIVPTLSPGGMEHYLFRFIKYTNGQIEPIVLCKTGKAGILLKDFEKLNVEVIRFKIGYINPVKWVKLWAYFKKQKIDTVCDFTGNFAGIVLFVALLANVKNRIVFYRRSSNNFKASILNNIYNIVLQKLNKYSATHLLFNSRAGMNFFYPKRNISDTRFKVIYNGFNINLFKLEDKPTELKKELGLPSNSFVIGHTGRFDSSKNHAMILKLANRLISKYDNIYLVLCGDGTEKIDSSTFSNKIIKLGYRKDVLDIIKVFDVFLFPSITEGQPNSLIEAMLTGLPVVTSDIDAIKETVPPDKITFLINPYDEATFFRVIEDIYLNKNTADYIYRDFALEKYNSEIQFEKFYNLL